jgi:hypothetical protein
LRSSQLQGGGTTRRKRLIARTFSTHINAQHGVSSAFQFSNVPMGLWVDEIGKVVRPAEPAWTANQALRIGAKSIVTEGEAYAAALRGWVGKGE